MSENPVGTDSFFRCHVFCCLNERPEDNPRGSCARRGAGSLQNYMKGRVKQLGLTGVRVNSAGCLDRCELGPTVVVYPEGIWYRAESRADIDAIVENHLRDGRPVQRLMLGLDDEEPQDRVV